MQRVALALHITARVLSILAALALLFTLWGEGLGVGFACFDTCYTPQDYFPRQLPFTMFLLTPCAVLAALALVIFLIYCLATRQPWRALIVLLFFLVGGLLGVAALNALVEHGRATVPIDAESGLLIEDSVVAWAEQWAQTVLLLGVVWAGGLACLEWGRRWRRLSQPTTP